MSRKPVPQEEQVAYVLAVVRLMNFRELAYKAACSELANIINNKLDIESDPLFKGIHEYLSPQPSTTKRKIPITFNKIDYRCTNKIGQFVMSLLVKKHTLLVGSNVAVSAHFPGESAYTPPEKTAKEYLIEIEQQKKAEQAALEDIEETFGPSEIPYVRNKDGSIQNLVIPDSIYKELIKNAGRSSNRQAPIERKTRIIKPLLFNSIDYFITLYETRQHRMH